MTERPMIFNSEMVRAILDGRKTQTRRPIKFPFKDRNLGCELSGNELAGELSSGNYLNSPFGKPSDRIWVRETFQGPLFDFDQMDAYCKDSAPFEKAQFCVYKADGKPAPEFFDADDNLHCCWRPSIHMPRWASRILLEIIDIRVERLNAIRQADAIAEGAPPSHPSIDCVSREYGFPDFSRSWFGQTWQHIYGEESWQANPWVWVVEFKRVKGGKE
ncbi:morphogenetic protein [Citrobacter braakii]|uniref:morphogenetic protein n=1 Tax=Citrobacter braakii TaxID=57706 RepID=UPI001BCAA4EF|nr:morphogenetic protein [Citrobacter braakii]